MLYIIVDCLLGISYMQPFTSSCLCIYFHKTILYVKLVGQLSQCSSYPTCSSYPPCRSFTTSVVHFLPCSIFLPTYAVFIICRCFPSLCLFFYILLGFICHSQTYYMPATDYYLLMIFIQQIILFIQLSSIIYLQPLFLLLLYLYITMCQKLIDFVF